MTLSRVTAFLAAVSLALVMAPCSPMKADGTGALVDAIRRNDVPAVRRSSRDEATREIDETGTTPLRMPRCAPHQTSSAC